MSEADAEYLTYKGMEATPLVAEIPLERDTLRRFVQAVMDTDPVYWNEAAAQKTRYGGLAAPPLYPVHAFRPRADAGDALDPARDDPEHDGATGIGSRFGLPVIPSPFKRLLNGGNEVEFYRCLHLGERAVAKPRYADIELKQGKSGAMLLVVVETRFETEAGELLLINRQTLIWR